MTVENYLASHVKNNNDDAFGVWSVDRVDGIAYENAIRDEWKFDSNV